MVQEPDVPFMLDAADFYQSGEQLKIEGDRFLKFTIKLSKLEAFFVFSLGLGITPRDSPFYLTIVQQGFKQE